VQLSDDRRTSAGVGLGGPWKVFLVCSDPESHVARTDTFRRNYDVEGRAVCEANSMRTSSVNTDLAETKQQFQTWL